MTRLPQSRPRPAQPQGRRRRRQSRQGAGGARRGGQTGRRPGADDRARPRRILPRGSGAEARLPEGLSRGGRGAPRRHARRRARRCSWPRPGARTASSTTPSSLLETARSSPRATSANCPTTTCSTRSAYFTPGPLPGPWSSRACASACRSARISGRPTSSNAWPSPAPRSCCAQRLALRDRQDRCPRQLGVAARGRNRPALRLSQPGRRPGRAGLRRRLVRHGRRPQAAGQLASFREGRLEFRRRRRRLGVPCRRRSRRN